MQVPTFLLLLLARLLRAAEDHKPQVENQTLLAEEQPNARSNNRILDHVVTKDQATQAAVKFDINTLGQYYLNSSL